MFELVENSLTFGRDREHTFTYTLEGHGGEFGRINVLVDQVGALDVCRQRAHGNLVIILEHALERARTLEKGSALSKA